MQPRGRKKNRGRSQFWLLKTREQKDTATTKEYQHKSLCCFSKQQRQLFLKRIGCSRLHHKKSTCSVCAACNASTPTLVANLDICGVMSFALMTHLPLMVKVLLKMQRKFEPCCGGCPAFSFPLGIRGRVSVI